MDWKEFDRRNPKTFPTDGQFVLVTNEDWITARKFAAMEFNARAKAFKADTDFIDGGEARMTEDVTFWCVPTLPTDKF